MHTLKLQNVLMGGIQGIHLVSLFYLQFHTLMFTLEVKKGFCRHLKVSSCHFKYSSKMTVKALMVLVKCYDRRPAAVQYQMYTSTYNLRVLKL